jgi:hypothetical protein
VVCIAAFLAFDGINYVVLLGFPRIGWDEGVALYTMVVFCELHAFPKAYGVLALT